MIFRFEEAFRVYFNRRRQYVSVFLHEVSPQTFHRRGGGRWGYYVPAEVRGRIGKFGELHFVLDRVRPDVVAHELLHLLADRMRGARDDLLRPQRGAPGADAGRADARLLA